MSTFVVCQVRYISTYLFIRVVFGEARPLHGCINCAGPSVDEEPVQVWVGDAILDVLVYDFLDLINHIRPALLRRALEGKLIDARGEGRVPFTGILDIVRTFLTQHRSERKQ